jgi:putative colanic acid biosynthesis UDP-glucose lipid carrier transferase
MALAVVRRHGFNTRRVAIVGARDLGAYLAQTILNTPSMGLMPIGFYDDRKLSGSRRVSGELAGDLDDLVDEARKGNVDLIYITLPMFAEARIKRLINRLSDSTVSVYLVPDVFMYELLHSKWGNVGDLPVISIFDTPFYGVDGWLKRALDVVLGSIILLIIAVPMLLIALGIKLTSSGSVFFKQRRYGMNGHMIEVWKFRTMKVSEDGLDVTQATRNDPRITPFGAFLRGSSLDELPQFINVLQGTMSIVGPRPHAVAHNEQYRKLISGYMLRHKVKPGITGLAQVNGWRGETDAIEKMQKRVEYDLGYIRNWSLGLDIKIILLTVFKGFSGKNAY